MATKRENGTGSVYKRKDLKHRPWLAVAPDTGIEKAKRVVIGHYATSKEAKAALAEYLQHPTEKLRYTFKQCYDDWYQINSRDRTKSWIDCHRAAFLRCRPLWDRELRALRAIDYQQLIDQTALEAPGSISLLLVAIRAANRYALENDVIQKDYSRFVRLPKKEKPKKDAFTSEELKTIRSAADQGDEDAERILVMCYTGFRVSEFLGLTQFSYDRDKHTLRGGLKTEAGKNRVVPVHSSIVPIVDKWVEKGAQYIFNPLNLSVPVFRNRFKAALKRLGIRQLTPHATRHTAATLLSNAGAAPQDIQKILGHAHFQMTADTYIHQSADQLTAAMEKIQA